MMTSAITAAIEMITEKKTPHRRPAEKLVLGVGSSMLFPTAGLHHPQGQKQKKKSQAHIEHHVARVDQPAGKIVHMVEKGDMREDRGLPAGDRGQMSGQITQQEQGDAQGKTDHGGHDLAVRQGGGEATERHEQPAQQKNSEKGAADQATIERL